MTVTADAFAATAGGFLLVLAIVLPVAGALLSFALGGRHAERFALGLMPTGLGIAIAIAVLLWRSGKPLVYVLGGFAPPLGIALRADGFSSVMLVTAAVVISAAGFFARANFATPRRMTEARAPLAFWILLQAIWAALNIIFVGGDLFNLYVALELLTFAAVPLVCLDGVQKRSPPRCAICFSRYSVRSFICLAPLCFTGLMARSTSSFWLAGFARRPPSGSRPG
jgi:multicomponent Na+:H+ antiporter subunit D